MKYRIPVDPDACQSQSVPDILSDALVSVLSAGTYAYEVWDCRSEDVLVRWLAIGYGHRDSDVPKVVRRRRTDQIISCTALRYVFSRRDVLEIIIRQLNSNGLCGSGRLSCQLQAPDHLSHRQPG